MGDQFLGHDAGGDARHRFTRARATTPAIVPKAVFRVVGVVRVTRAILVLDVGIVATALVLVTNQDREARASGAALEHTAQNFGRVRFLPLGDEPTLAGLAAVQVDQQILHGKRDARGATIDDDDIARPV